MGAEKIAITALLVDDTDVVRVTLARVLRRLGAEVTEVSSGEDALAHLAQVGMVDVVLLDLNMPGLSGAETFAQLRTQFPAQIVIFISGQGDLGDAQDLLELPGTDFIQKPFRAAALREVLEGVLRQRET